MRRLGFIALVTTGIVSFCTMAAASMASKLPKNCAVPIRTFAAVETWVGAYTQTLRRDDTQPTLDFFRLLCQGQLLSAEPAGQTKPTVILIGEHRKIRIFSNQNTKAYYAQVISPTQTENSTIQLPDDGTWIQLNALQYTALLKELIKFKDARTTFATRAQALTNTYVYDYAQRKNHWIPKERMGRIVEFLLGYQTSYSSHLPQKPLYQMRVGTTHILVDTNVLYLVKNAPNTSDLSKLHAQAYMKIDQPLVGETFTRAISPYVAVRPLD